jgi:hypothetical protein
VFFVGLDQPKVVEALHKQADPWSGRAHHLGQFFAGNLQFDADAARVLLAWCGPTAATSGPAAPRYPPSPYLIEALLTRAAIKPGHAPHDPQEDGTSPFYFDQLLEAWMPSEALLGPATPIKDPNTSADRSDRKASPHIPG